MEDSSLNDREAEFWDAVAEGHDSHLIVQPEDLFDKSYPWLGYLDMDVFSREIFDVIGVRPGLEVLDLGCGQGFLSIALAHRGCKVTGIDISPKSIESCKERAALSGVSDNIDFQVMDCANTPFEDNSFDAICGKFVLHHLDLEKAGEEMSRLLRPGGRLACVETMGLNPLLMLARSTLPGRFGIEKASSDDEYPLTQDRLDILEQATGSTLEAKFPKVVFFRMGGYVGFLNRPFFRSIFAGIDAGLTAIPACQRLSYYGVVTIEPDQHPTWRVARG